MDGGGEALGQANLPVNTPGARGLQSLRTRRPPRHQPGWSAQRWEENIVVLGYNRPEANLVGVFQNGCFTPAILSKTYTRFVHFYEKFRLGLGRNRKSFLDWLPTTPLDTCLSGALVGRGTPDSLTVGWFGPFWMLGFANNRLTMVEFRDVRLLGVCLTRTTRLCPLQACSHAHLRRAYRRLRKG